MSVGHGRRPPRHRKGAVRAGRDYGIQVMGDIMLAPDKPACARRMQEFGVDYIIVHTGFDERNEEIGKSPLDDLPSVREAVTIPSRPSAASPSSRRSPCPPWAPPSSSLAHPWSSTTKSSNPATPTPAWKTSSATSSPR